jgi:putative peptide zinc metalloprotease protein
MNLTEALNTALPEIPAFTRELLPKLRPNLLAREHTVRGVPVVVGVIQETGYIYRWAPEEWELLKLFDGTRTLQEVSDIYAERFGVRYSADFLRELVDLLDGQDFWYKTPLEHNIALQQRLAEERQKKAKKSKYGDVSDLRLIYWNPNNYLHAIYPYLKFIYTPWFTALSFVAMALTLYIFLDHGMQILLDTVRFYTFTLYTAPEYATFWLLTCFVLFIHESAHGLTCVHYGGNVYKMGFNLIYMTPAFYTEAQQIFVLGNKWQRLNTIVWGAWSELLLCFIVTPIWWGTPPGSLIHEVCYMLILVTGVAVVLLNINPLIKLDGYYALTELLELPMLKEESTAYVTSWVKKYLWRLPVEVPFVPRRRRLGYVIYCLVSGLYSYSLLLWATRLLTRIATSFSPDWGFLVGLAVGYRLFRSRIHAFGRLMKAVYLDKKERVQAWLNRPRLAATVAVAGVVLFVPFWPESVQGPFVLEPLNRAPVRVVVPGTVAAVHVEEGQHVKAGMPVATLRNLALESEAAQSAADYQVASARATRARLLYTDYAAAEKEQERLAELSRNRAEEVSRLQLISPIHGTVLTPRVRDRVGSYLEAGIELAEVADLSTLRARIYLRESEIRKARPGQEAKLLVHASPIPVSGTVAAIAPVASKAEAGLVQESVYRGIQTPNFYACDIHLANPEGLLRPQMSGTAKVFTGRHSIAGLLWEPVRDFLSRRIW